MFVYNCIYMSCVTFSYIIYTSAVKTNDDPCVNIVLVIRNKKHLIDKLVEREQKESSSAKFIQREVWMGFWCTSLIS